jgi:hypothetical protein
VKINKRWYALLVIPLALLILFFVFRNTLLQSAFAKAQVSARSYGVQVNAQSVRFSGIDEVALKNITLCPLQGDTLAHIKALTLNLSVTDLLTGKIGFDDIQLQDALFTIYNLPGRNNIDSISYGGSSAAPLKTGGETTYRKKANALKARLFRLLNTAFTLQNVQLVYEDTAGIENVYVPKLAFDKRLFLGRIVNQGAKDTIVLSGEVIKKTRDYHFVAERSNATNIYLPFLNRQGKVKSCFKKIDASIAFDDSGSELQITTKVTVENFHFNHWRLANDDVVFERAGFNGKLKVGDNFVELDSSSVITMQGITTNVFANYSTTADSVFTISAHMPQTVSDTFFNGLPKGMFNTLKGISCTGSLAYDLFFQINTRNPDSLIFNSALTKKDFGIRHYGAENYARMNGSFTYQAYDKDRFVRSIQVGEENPMFTPLNRISDYLIKSVLQSEDPSFMLHRGFLPEAFRESIVKNYKERRFARGGSTISMQLVKNVFLSRDKTVSRKAEEALIVYLIENLRLVPKERMLEVYLNVIEWGPNVYGIGEAARFYFNKQPSQLTLQESIFLAGIIPRPKYFKYQFDKEGNLKDYLDDYFRILTGRMAFKGWISAADTTGLRPDVKLKGPALRMILPDDTVTPEPLMDEE